MEDETEHDDRRKGDKSEAEWRAHALEWRGHMEEKLEKIVADLETNTRITTRVATKMAPVIDALDRMEAGIIFIGRIGTALAWIGRKTWRAIRVLAPIAGAIGTAYVAFHDQFVWMIEQVKRFWK